jgi:hypothetical protein
MWETGVTLMGYAWWRAEMLLCIAVTHSRLEEYDLGRLAASRILQNLDSETMPLRLAAEEYIAGTWWQQGQMAETQAALQQALTTAQVQSVAHREASIRQALDRLAAQTQAQGE